MASLSIADMTLVRCILEFAKDSIINSGSKPHPTLPTIPPTIEYEFNIRILHVVNVKLLFDL